MISAAGRGAPASISLLRCADPPGWRGTSAPRSAPSSRRACPPAWRARWVSTWPAAQPGNLPGDRACSSVRPATAAISRACAARHSLVACPGSGSSSAGTVPVLPRIALPLARIAGQERLGLAAIPGLRYAQMAGGR
jgi:hypothetical protein